MHTKCRWATALFVLTIGTASATSSHSVRGHVTKKGAYVAPSRATDPNKKKSDNWSHKGNVNPYTGKNGTKEN
jgi:hypothetical protein